MTKENIKLFQKCTLNQAGWLISVKKLLTRLRLWNYQIIERVKFHRWNLGDGTITESEPSANVPDFTALRLIT